MTTERNELLEKIKAQSDSLQQYLNAADFDREVALLKGYEEKHALIEKKREALQIELNTLLTEAKNMINLLGRELNHFLSFATRIREGSALTESSGYGRAHYVAGSRNQATLKKHKGL